MDYQNKNKNKKIQIKLKSDSELFHILCQQELSDGWKMNLKSIFSKKQNYQKFSELVVFEMIAIEMPNRI